MCVCPFVCSSLAFVQQVMRDSWPNRKHLAITVATGAMRDENFPSCRNF